MGPPWITLVCPRRLADARLVWVLKFYTSISLLCSSNQHFNIRGGQNAAHCKICSKQDECLPLQPVQTQNYVRDKSWKQSYHHSRLGYNMLTPCHSLCNPNRRQQSQQTWPALRVHLCSNLDNIKLIFHACSAMLRPVRPSAVSVLIH